MFDFLRYPIRLYLFLLVYACFLESDLFYNNMLSYTNYFLLCSACSKILKHDEFWFTFRMTNVISIYRVMIMLLYRLFYVFTFPSAYACKSRKSSFALNWSSNIAAHSQFSAILILPILLLFTCGNFAIQSSIIKYLHKNLEHRNESPLMPYLYESFIHVLNSSKLWFVKI